jgi:hypothetical protein
VTFREYDTVRKIFAPVRRNGILDSPEHEQEGELLGYRRVESFFKTLKRKLETLDDKHSVTELGQSVFMYVKAYYNRMHWIRALEFTLHGYREITRF